MPTCFVIQPFDLGKFDKRYDDVYEPAISKAGLEAYRVDRDPNVDIPIDAIEEGIRKAVVCLADITTDNPNVWYELGFAFATGKPVIMVCSEERTGRKYPFDIQHRSVVNYKTESLRDFEQLRESLTKRIKAQAEKGEALRQIAETEQVAPLEGLSQPELFVLAAVTGDTTIPGDTVSAHIIKNEVERAGLTNIGFSLGLRRLIAKAYIKITTEQEYNSDPYQALTITEPGWDWIEANESKFVVRKPDNRQSTFADLGDDIPF